MCAEDSICPDPSLRSARNQRGSSCTSVFPNPGDYACRLERVGFRVDRIVLIPRPTPLPGDIIDWLETFAQCFLDGLSERVQGEYLDEVRTALEPQIRDRNGVWMADYVRLRFAVTKTARIGESKSCGLHRGGRDRTAPRCVPARAGGPRQRTARESQRYDILYWSGGNRSEGKG